jgi:RNA polymerase sigma-70 factor (ECF subfamily)
MEADTAAFEEWRSLLFGIAYRMLGSAADAEDVVQDAYLRWRHRPEGEVESVRAYLVTVTTRLCIDQLSSARVQRVTYTGPWLPEPVVSDEVDRAAETDSLSLAFLVLLEELTPPERAAYLLHDIFGYHFDEVAEWMGRTPVACRQLASRDLRQGRELTRRFVTACGTGDLEGLLRLLAEDVIVWSDGGGVVRAAVRPVVGRHRSSRFLLHVAKKFHGVAEETVLNGQPATVFVTDGHVAAALVLDIIEGSIVGVRVVTNPEKLGHLDSLFTV